MEKIDWDKIPEGFDWCATDEDGGLWAFEYEPTDGFCSWYAEDGKGEICVSGPVVGGYKGGGWRESLQQRPPKEPEIKFGPRPEKLWVGMKGVNGFGITLALKSMEAGVDIAPCSRLEWVAGEVGEAGYLNYCTSIEGEFWGVHPSKHDIVEWEQPQEAPSKPDWKAKYADLYLAHMEKVDECTTLREWYEESESAPDWRAKYEQLQQKVADLIDYRESYAELRWHYLRLKDELERTQAELNDVYKDREKLNKIVKIIYGLGHE